MAERKEELPDQVWDGLQVLRKDLEVDFSPTKPLSEGILKIKDPSIKLQCYLLLLIFNELRKRP